MLSEVYKKERQPPKTGGCLSFFLAFVTDKGKSASQRAKKKETPRGKTATLPYEKMPLRTKKSVDIPGKIWYDILGEI